MAFIVEDLIRETTVSTGTGLTINLIADGNYGRFSNVGIEGDTTVYAIRSGNNSEVGIGIIRDSNRLDRTTPIATVVDGIYNNNSPSRIDLVGVSTVTLAPSSYVINRMLAKDLNLSDLLDKPLAFNTIKQEATPDSSGVVEKATTAEAQSGAANVYPDAAGVHSAIYQIGLTKAQNLSDVNNALTAFNNIKQAATVELSGVVEAATTAEAIAGTANKFPDAQKVKEAIDAKPAFPAGTRMLFQQSAAPVGWTKDTTHNNKALRIVSGNIANGGSIPFTTAFGSKSVTGTISSVRAGGSVTVNDHTLSVNQIPSHTHSYNRFTGEAGNFTNGGPYGRTRSFTSGAIGGGAAHNHSASFSGANHNHSFTGAAIDINVQYVDVIIAVKN